MGKCARKQIDKAQLEALRNAGFSNQQIADRMGVNVGSVSRAATRFGLTPKLVVEQSATEEAVPATSRTDGADVQSPLPPTERFSAERDIAIIQARGCYDQINRFAAAWGIPARSVTMRWHQLRVNLPCYR